jgi:glycosyltransferase involved in cell wall biosynthesis
MSIVKKILSFPVAKSVAEKVQSAAMKDLPDGIDYLLVMPTFIRGGAEKVALNYARAVHELRPEMSIGLVITDENTDLWIEKMPGYVTLIDAVRDKGAGLTNKYRREILDAIIRKMKPTVIHVINSGPGYYWVADNAEWLKRNKSAAYASLFNSDYSKSGKKRSFYHKHVPAAAEALRRIFTDNAAVIDEAIEYTGLPRELFGVHYQPVNLEMKRAHGPSGKRPIQILWASRVTWQKRPDLLLLICNMLDAKKYKLTVRGAMSDGYGSNMFDELDGVNYGGGFSSVAELETEKYDLFLYTSQADGMPNMLLEMMSEGLPIIASDVGGVKELINDRTGLLVTPFDDASKYIEAIDAASDMGKQLVMRVEAGQKLIAERHSWGHFIKDVKNDMELGYENTR